MQNQNQIQNHGGRRAEGFALHPVGIVSAGCPTEPSDRLIGVQSTVGRLVDLLVLGFRRREPRAWSLPLRNLVQR
jgi:hypothetical protein